MTTTMERQVAWARGLVALDVAAVLLWLPLTSVVDALGPFVLGEGYWWLLPPAVLVVLGFLGFGMWARAGRQQRAQHQMMLLFWASVLVLTPLALYAMDAYLIATMPAF
jgi:hypothetical protein